VKELNAVYKATPALWSQDIDPAGFAWIDANDAPGNVYSFLRFGSDGSALASGEESQEEAQDSGGSLAVGANLAAGGSGRPQLLSDADRRIAAQVGPELKRRGLMFVGLDVIGEHLTEINVTSPTCAREIDAAYGTDIGGMLMDAIDRRLSNTGQTLIA